ncbi:MAG: hypothetical protein J6I66_00740 [Lachnospiraceae bacterium]|nr:hypothetical protein [Eubacterium sp.]MBP3753367.1 hypothetical protein [Lachnospiraceae bacterium]
MLVDEIWDFKSLNMGRELEIAGEFIYDSVKEAMSIKGLNNTYEINIILYTGAVGIERLQKIYLCLVAPDPTDVSSMPKCLGKHNHIDLQHEVNKFSKDNLTKNAMSLLGVFADYYNNFRYANYYPGQPEKNLRKLFIGFLKRLNGKFNFDEPCAAVQFEEFKRFYINELGKLAVHYYSLIHEKARELNTYTYEIDSFSRAARVFWSVRRRALYEQMILEQNATKELLLYIYKKNRGTGVFRLLDEMEALDFDDGSVNEYLEDLCAGKVNDLLIDYVDDSHEDIEDIAKRKERKDLLSLIGNSSVMFDLDEEDENEE